jgi:hypothetical protein
MATIAVFPEPGAWGPTNHLVSVFPAEADDARERPLAAVG